MQERVQKEGLKRAQKIVADDKEKERLAERSKQPAEDSWSVAQQSQMEAMMKEVPASIATKERWITIAKGVEGRTPKECYTRYTLLVAK